MKSIASRLLPFAAVAVTLVSLSGSARADALPLDACSSASDVGQTCNNAGTNNDESGICVASTCHSASPPDGGSEYACAICEQLPIDDSDAGALDAGNSTSDGGGAITVRDDAGTTSTPGSTSSGGCSATPDSRDGATGFAMLAVGMIGLGLSRRKKKSA